MTNQTSSLLSNANSLMVDEEYEEALEEYNLALESEQKKSSDSELLFNIFLKRSACHLKIGNYIESLSDANSALKIKEDSYIGYLRKGISLFELEEFKSAERAFEKGLEIKKNHKQLKRWLRKAKLEIEIEEGDESNEKEKEKEKEEEKEKVKEKKQKALEIEKKGSSSETEESSKKETQTEEKKPTFRRDWFQNREFVSVTIFIKGRTREDCEIDFAKNDLSISIKIDKDRDYVLYLDLYSEIVPSECKFIVNKSNVEIKCKKKESTRWKSLERKEELETNKITKPPKTEKKQTNLNLYPSSKSPKDWDKLVRESVVKEKKEKLIKEKLKEGKSVEEIKSDDEELKYHSDSDSDGGDPMTKFLRKIYSGGNVDIKRAMEKSFSESGGTVLSTNWNEVGKKKVEGKAPDGMVMKQWEK
ncbi:protein sgt1 [Anaeramoeba flamelloides]|uniref:Protein sgt1 n=1 Tax=Anaeramoeba flamelloides TaxID=1746091 RepID=A0AAV7YGX8_9EUKA|nr:protein sgt1 [Anaeramoeba flamelloides]KAJ6230915.1 protein sgt1 [Anaeramoeba flamelloides]